jgi:carbon-monoxide dehydrogenase small subunit
MSMLSFEINGEKVDVTSEARTSLADLLRDEIGLTGTHLGCEQGVCGACTVLVDGVPVRSCISNAASCQGSEIRTIEGFDDDPVMVELRAAFNRHHALQCGFCTPGMLVMARDIVTRLGDVDEERIRVELAGNLCRCTGYAGIVKAIRAVIVERLERGIANDVPAIESLGPAGSGHAAPSGSFGGPAAAAEGVARETQRRLKAPTGLGDADRAPAVTQKVTIAAAPDAVWARFGDVSRTIRCIPGATLVSEQDGLYEVRMRIRMGPVGADFSGVAAQRRDEATKSGVITGEGRDTKSASLARGELGYRISGPMEGPTEVDIRIDYVLSGALGQFARSGIVTHFIAEITRQFAANLERSLAGDDAPADDELRITGSLGAAFKAWIGAAARRLLGR